MLNNDDMSKTKHIYSIFFVATGDWAYMDRKPTEDDLKAIVWKNKWLNGFEEDDNCWKDIREQIHVLRHAMIEPKNIKIKNPRPKYLF